MEYSKPEVTSLGECLNAIQMTGKQAPPHDNGKPSETTTNAYESDE